VPLTALLTVETVTTPHAPDVGSNARRSHDLPLLHHLAQHPTSLSPFHWVRAGTLHEQRALDLLVGWPTKNGEAHKHTTEEDSDSPQVMLTKIDQRNTQHTCERHDHSN